MGAGLCAASRGRGGKGEEGGGGEEGRRRKGTRGRKGGCVNMWMCCGIKGHVERRVYTREGTEVWAHDKGPTHTISCGRGGSHEAHRAMCR